jgi:hypothetical protein
MLSNQRRPAQFRDCAVVITRGFACDRARRTRVRLGGWCWRECRAPEAITAADRQARSPLPGRRTRTRARDRAAGAGQTARAPRCPVRTRGRRANACAQGCECAVARSDWDPRTRAHRPSRASTAICASITPIGRPATANALMTALWTTPVTWGARSSTRRASPRGRSHSRRAAPSRGSLGPCDC